ncbi:MAG: VCBS repeat-containing protein [Methylacidiphilales bacterium]|nr:VCBS repeat-containing protein [Candidatus Methylacidiphilales bacterium]
MILRLSALSVFFPKPRLQLVASLLASFFALAPGLPPLRAEVILKSNFETYQTMNNPWGGVSGAGLISVTPGSQPAVNNAGETVDTQFAPSIAVGDLNNDGLKDLVIADPKGFFWYFPNSGTPAQPKFTFGEIIPIWLGVPSDDPSFKEGGNDNPIPRIQLVDVTGDGTKPDLMVGTYSGALYYLHNIGTAKSPIFNTAPSELKAATIKTRKDGLLWCNFLAPCLYNWFGHGLDMIMGDGSYSANSIFLFNNLGSIDRPVYTENFMTKIIPGMGREHLTPQVIDWNHDGKPDIITGDRLGHITLFLNTSTDEAHPTFDEGRELTIAGQATFGEMTAVTVCDLSNNGLPNLIISNNAGQIYYALNTGKPGAPQFNTLAPIKGQNPFPQVLRPVDWGNNVPNNPSGLSYLPWGGGYGVPYGVAYELLVCTNSKVEPGFKPPPDTNLKCALRYYVLQNKNVYFPKSYYPVGDPLFDDNHGIAYKNPVSLKEGTAYHVSFWYRSNGGVKNLGYRIAAQYGTSDADAENPAMGEALGSGDSWAKYDSTIQYDWQKEENKKKHHHDAVNMTLWFYFNGQGNIYLDDVTIAAEQTGI